MIYIRSQDKLILMQLNEKLCVVNRNMARFNFMEEEQPPEDIHYIIISYGTTLGEYESEYEATKVLDMIQEYL